MNNTYIVDVFSFCRFLQKTCELLLKHKKTLIFLGEKDEIRRNSQPLVYRITIYKKSDPHMRICYGDFFIQQWCIAYIISKRKGNWLRTTSCLVFYSFFTIQIELQFGSLPRIHLFLRTVLPQWMIQIIELTNSI